MNALVEVIQAAIRHTELDWLHTERSYDSATGHHTFRVLTPRGA